ncbi:periphilin-1 [Callorhinchus milii]|nr:periphilin-1 [Callorhinchus milii]|eukprot:gi/632954189/ref/XP_007892829.1/ PREDICTED: periphilin-1 [Callorhinchus milii]
MWSESRSQFGEINPRGRFHPGRGKPVGNAEYERPITVIQRRHVYDRGGGRGTNCDYNYYHSEEYNHSVDYQDYSGYSGENRGSTYGRLRGPPPKTGSWDDENGRWFREEHSGNRPLDYRDNFKRNHYHLSQHVRDRSHKRESPYYRVCVASRKESPHSRSGSSISSRSYSPEKSKAPPSHHSQYSKNKERSSVSSLTPSRDESPSSSTVASKSASFEKASKSSDNLNKEIVNDWSEKQQIPELEISEHSESFDGVQMQNSEKLDGLETNARSSIDLIDLTQADNRTRAIAEKTKEIEEVYRQDCETFGLVVQMLIDKDPTLEKTMQFALRENLREIGERCIEELRTFITHYDIVPGEHTDNL